MASDLRISCIMPVRNGAAYIAQALESLVRQDHPPFEIIVVDDGSTDDSVILAVAAGRGLVRLAATPSLGCEAARNHALAMVRGDAVFFLDSDDRLPADALRALACALSENPGWDGAFGHWRNFWIEALADEEADQPHLSGDQHSLMLTAGLLRTEVFRRYGLLPTEDSWYGPALWLGAARSAGANFGRIPHLVLERRVHFGNMSRNKKMDELPDLVLKLHRQRRKPAGDSV